MKIKFITLAALAVVATNTIAGIKVSDVKVFSGHPWKEVVIGYTITGTAADAEFIQLKLMVADLSANETYTARSLTGGEVTEGRHALRWDPMAEGFKFSSTNVVFSVSIVRMGVQLWENGPYWAECNVGATNPEEYGYYFSWGDTVGYKLNANNNGWISVKDSTDFSFVDENCPTFIPNCSWSEYVKRLRSAGFIDAADNLVAAHDAATAHLGAPWRMPTGDEIQALHDNCTATWTNNWNGTGVNGQLVTGKDAYASKSIFLPAAGYGERSYLCNHGSQGEYWSSTRLTFYDNPRNVYELLFYSHPGFGLLPCEISRGLPVRAVRGFAK